MFDCPRCEERLQSFAQLDKHMEEEHQERGYGDLNGYDLNNDWDCPVCEAKFNHYSVFRSHLNEMHLDKEVRNLIVKQLGQPLIKFLELLER